MQGTIDQWLQELGGLDNAESARLARAVIRALVEQFPAGDRTTFLGKLPAGLDRPHGDAAAMPCATLPLFYERVSALTELPIARATEISQVVLSALTERLDVDTRAWVTARLPEALTVLLAPRQLAARPPEPHHMPRRYATLADARPGSTHPLSEARPERAHRDSVARSDDPHGDTKLSSSLGPTQAREHETLAEADPRPARRLSTGEQ